MPLYRFICPKCQHRYSKFVRPEKSDILPKYLCADCAIELERDSETNFTSVKETIDNGLMDRRVEQYQDSHDLVKEREQLATEDKNKKTL